MNDSMSAELGLIEDKQFISSCHGFITANNNIRNLNKEFIPKGDNFFDALSRYDDLCSYVLARDAKKAATAIKMSIPFLKSFGVSDLAALEFSKKDLKLLNGAKETMSYLYEMLPTFVSTGSLEHHMMAVCDATDFPMMNVGCPRPSFDNLEMTKQEMRTLRDYAKTIASLNVSHMRYINTEAKMVDNDDVTLLAECDRIFLDEMPKMNFYKDYEKLESVGINEKSYALLEIRKKTEIELSSTIYVGGDISDAQALDLVRDSSGLSISFNGNEHAVHGCNVAVMSDDATVISVLAEDFYNGGIESVFSLIDDWTPAKLKKRPMDENSPLKMLLKKHPKKLPVVKKVDRHNVDEISAQSEKYRDKLIC